MTQARSPRGVVAVVTNAAGEVVAHGDDFDTGLLLEFSLRETQEIRAKEQAHIATIKGYCSPVMRQAVDGSCAAKIFQNLLRDHGHRLTIIPIGHEVGK